MYVCMLKVCWMMMTSRSTHKHVHIHVHKLINDNRTSTIPPVSAAAVYWAQAHGQITDEWLRLHLLPAAFQVRDGCHMLVGQCVGSRHWIRSQPTHETEQVPTRESNSKIQGADPHEAWVAIGWLLELLHLPALR